MINRSKLKDKERSNTFAIFSFEETQLFVMILFLVTR